MPLNSAPTISVTSCHCTNGCQATRATTAHVELGKIHSVGDDHFPVEEHRTLLRHAPCRDETVLDWDCAYRFWPALRGLFCSFARKSVAGDMPKMIGVASQA